MPKSGVRRKKTKTHKEITEQEYDSVPKSIVMKRTDLPKEMKLFEKNLRETDYDAHVPNKTSDGEMVFQARASVRKETYATQEFCPSDTKSVRVDTPGTYHDGRSW